MDKRAVDHREIKTREGWGRRVKLIGGYVKGEGLMEY